MTDKKIWTWFKALADGASVAEPPSCHESFVLQELIARRLYGMVQYARLLLAQGAQPGDHGDFQKDAGRVVADARSVAARLLLLRPTLLDIYPPLFDFVLLLVEDSLSCGKAAFALHMDISISAIARGDKVIYNARRGGRGKKGYSRADSDKQQKFLSEMEDLNRYYPKLSYTARVERARRRSGLPLGVRQAGRIAEKNGRRK